jgi:MFS family permease
MSVQQDGGPGAVGSPPPGDPAAADTPAAAPSEILDAEGRPISSLPAFQLVRISLYWLGLTCVFQGINVILEGRLKYENILPDQDAIGAALFQMLVLGVVIAILVQPTIGTISDYTISRWGRRKPYIFVGSVLDLLFLYAIASSNTVLAIAIFVALLQFSSNFAQGPFQGYVPDLVPAPQVGTASALVGMFSVLGNVTGFAVASLAVYTDQFFLGTMALGVVEFVTMLSVVLHVSEGRKPRSREGRSWFSVAGEAWGTDILRERSFLFLVGSRLLFLMGGGMVAGLSLWYMSETMGLSQGDTAVANGAVLAIVAVVTVLVVVPSGRISDRVGRKPVIYVACLIGIVALSILAVAPNVAVALVGAALYGASGGIFLAVDWALMTDIIPKAASGRYMGISNVATASSGILAIAIGGAIVRDNVNAIMGEGVGMRAAMVVGACCYVGAALLLTQVVARRREGDEPESPASLAAVSVPG